MAYSPYGTRNFAPFSNLQAWSYWTNIICATKNNFVYFDFQYGSQNTCNKFSNIYAQVVHEGNISPDSGIGGTAPDPEPSTMLLLGSGLVGLVGYGRRRFKK